jgi:hypothetical protein
MRHTADKTGVVVDVERTVPGPHDTRGQGKARRRSGKRGENGDDAFRADPGDLAGLVERHVGGSIRLERDVLRLLQGADVEMRNYGRVAQRGRGCRGSSDACECKQIQRNDANEITHGLQTPRDMKAAAAIHSVRRHRTDLCVPGNAGQRECVTYVQENLDAPADAHGRSLPRCRTRWLAGLPARARSLEPFAPDAMAPDGGAHSRISA